VTSRERVLTSCRFEQPDRIPRFDSFWEFPEDWKSRFNSPEKLTDVLIWAGDEKAFPTRAQHIRTEAGWVYEREGWGRTIRRRKDAYFLETLDVPIPAGVDPDSVQFDSPMLDERYLRGHANWEELESALQHDRQRYSIFAKTGGPFLRTTFVRGETQFLIDIAQDPPLAKALADKVADHITQVGCEEIRRWSLRDTGIWIFDDMAYNDGPLFSPSSFERIFLPAYRRGQRRDRRPASTRAQSGNGPVRLAEAISQTRACGRHVQHGYARQRPA